ncbi:MAG: CBS domain-containing protein [Nitrospirae bacterium]|nr:CBS domain-containing protein [Nitrospirota bacterium]MCL5421350.1 CBS domain-containing protein [Nitrospirota bacterium]
MDIITSHTNADFDAFASMMAAGKLYPDAWIVFPGSQEKKVRDFISAFQPVEIRRVKDVDLLKVKRLIIVDTKSPERIGPFAELVSKSGGPLVHIYDHHPRTKGDIPGSVEVIEDVGATATIFAEILKSRKIPITPMEATILCLGIYEETGSLLFPSTTERDILAVASLLKRGASLKIVSSFLRTELSKEELDLLNEFLKSSADMEIDGIRIKIVKASREDYVGDAAHFAHRIMDMEDTDALILLLGMQGKIVMVSRSRVPELDVAEVMKRFGGGGHSSAASAIVKEIPLEVVEDEVKGLLKSSIRHGKSARDVMTSPVITISWNGTVKNAESMMTRYGVNVLPVVRDGKYRGIISREIVEKAIFHGFGKSTVGDFTTTDAQTVSHDAQVRDIERLMIEQNQRFMPVLEGDRIIGAITRTDILRLLYEDMLKRSRLHLPAEERPSMGRNLATWLREKFPPSISDMLKLAGETADGLGFKAYLVGGSVRDLLRGEENLDIDIVIEGDGIAFAKEFGQRLNAKVRTHERFGTAQIITEHLKLDVATARTEYYESPAALPTVETSSIKKDLYRRDFTINTLAVALNPRDFGLLIDFFGGQRDLREKTIRVLHNLSFIEDPTRAFRAVRFSERFGFKLSKHTENLIKSALRMDLFDKLSGSRLYEELLLTFSETEPVKAIKRLSEYGLLKVIHPNLLFDGRLESALQSIHDTLSWFNLLFLEEKPDKGDIYLMALLSTLSEDERGTAFARLSTPSKIKEKINRGILHSRELIRALPLRDPAGIYKALQHLDLETILFAMAVAVNDNKKKEISRYLIELRRVKPQCTGWDLKNMGILPGPLYSEILDTLLEERLRGNLKTREDELAFVRERYKTASSY